MTEPTVPVDGWVLVEFGCGPATAEILSDDLWSRGVAAVEEIDAPDGGVILRTSLGPDSSAVIAEIEAVHGVTSRLVSFPSSVADTWRQYAEATHVVDGVWLVPAWLEPPTTECVLVEPFDTFGLGNHPTTLLSLRAALVVTTGEQRVLDLGSGSGVLAVALARLSGCRVDAHDIAPQGESVLHHNATLNGVASSVAWRAALNDSDASTYDVVVANILAPVLRELSGIMQLATCSGGMIILSGMRDEQVADVVARFDSCTVVNTDSLGGWSAVTLRRA